MRAFYSPGTSGVLVAVFHGLSGDTDADYMRATSGVARAAGHSVLLVNHRGCGAGRGLARGLYHSGRSDDLASVFGWARARLPETQHVGVGFSLSGNALLLLLADPAAPQPSACLSINPPIHLANCSDRISSGANRVYDQRFVRRCVQSLRERVQDGLLPSDFRIPEARTLREFDDEVTAPLGGFANAEDYYRRCSTFERLDRIEVPTVILTAADDPFVRVEDFRAARLSPKVHLHIEPHGGHVGYLERGGIPLSGHKWLDGALAHYIEELCAAVRDSGPSRGS